MMTATTATMVQQVHQRRLEEAAREQVLWQGDAPARVMHANRVARLLALARQVVPARNDRRTSAATIANAAR